MLKLDNSAKDNWQTLSSIADLTTTSASSREDFISECRQGKHDGTVAAYRTFNSIAQTGLWDEELCAELPKSFRFIGHNGAGYDQINPAVLSSRDPPILVSNVPTAVDDSTADTGIFLVLGALRNFPTGLAALRRGAWRGRNLALGHDPEGKLVGVLGMGGIGRNFANKCRAFGMKVAYHNRHRLSPELEDGATYMGFEELLRKCDVLSLNLPLSKATRHIIGKDELAMMKQGVVIINTARGAVVDEAALVDALDSGHIGCVGLDVYEEEPKVHPGLASNEKVLLLPHMGTWTLETQTKMENWNIESVRKAVLALGGDKEKWREISIIPEQKDLIEKEINRPSA